MGGYKGVSGTGWRLVGAMVLVASLVATPAFAQLNVGTILGTAKDTSGGVMAGATVTALNTETGSSRTATTGDDGVYRFSALPVGHYDVKIERSGFKTATKKGVVLDVAGEVVTNLALEVGAAATEVTVTGDAPVVNTTNGTLGGLVDEQKIDELPLNGRNYLDLTLLQPGVSQATTVINLGGGTQGAIYSSNGAPIISNSFLLDGTPMQTVFGFNGASASGTTLGVDGIREYKVVTNAFSAEYGMNMGSQMTIVSKGGGNQFHGDVFEYLRNRVLDARNFFDTSYQQSGKRNPQYERNNFGGAFGGPIKKDKTFFWGVYEGLRQVKGFPVITNSIPAACVTESASSSHQVDSACDPNITTPFTVNSAIQPLVALYTPDNSNYTFTSPTSVNYGQIRVDHNLTKDDSLFGRYTIEQAYEVVPGPGNDSSNAVPYGYKQFKDTWTSRNQYVTLTENHIFSPTFLNSARLSFSRTNVPTNYIITDPAVTLDNVTFSAQGSGTPIGLLVIGSGGNGSPGGITTLGPDLASPNYHLQNYWSLGDDAFYTRGKHALKFGVLINRINLVIGETVFNRGRLNFRTCNASNTDPLVCFLNNEPSLELGATKGGIGRRHFNYYTYGFYGQDDWRATSRLTLNLGLRYEFNTSIREAHGLESSFRDLNTNPATTYTQGPIMRNASFKNVSPRVGFAYDVTGTGKTSVRGAFGIYYDVATIGMTTFVEVVGDPPFRAINGVPGQNLPSGFQPNFLTTQPFAGPFIGKPGADPAYPQFPGYSFALNLNGYDDYLAKQPYLMQWNLSVDRQLPGGIGLTVSYVGTRGEHIWGQQEGNPCKPTGYDDAANTIPNWTQGCEGTYVGTGPAPLGQRCAVLATFPVPPFQVNYYSARSTCNLGFVSEITTNSRSWYDGLQMSLQKKLAHGLEFQSSYTYSKNLDTDQGQLFIDSEIRTNNTTLNIDKGRSNVDATHNWRFNTLYHFPGPKSDNVGAKLLNGWWMGNIISVQSGYAFTPLLTTNRSQSGVAGGQNDRPNYAATYDAGKVIVGDPNKWFDTSMFAVQPLGHLGNTSRGILTGPGLFNWDFSIVKDTKLALLGEAGQLMFRADFFNVLNHANFNNPTPSVTGFG